MDSSKTVNKGSKWLALYTKPRHEKKVAERLSELGIETYCPIQRIRKQWSDRIKIVEEPLFKSYVFVLINPEYRQKVFEVHGTVRFLFWQGKPAEIRSHEIETLKRWLNEFDHSSIIIEPISEGDTVKFESGIFQGETASVIRKQGKMIFLEMLAFGVRIKVSESETILTKVKS